MATTKKKIIPIEVRDEYILGSGVSIGAAGSYDSVILEVKFDESWAGLNKYATWTNALGEIADQIIITLFNGVDGLEDTYYIPVTAPAAKYAGTVKLSFTGYALSRGEGDRTIESLINTASGSFRVLESNADPLGDGSVDATLAQQLLTQLNDHMTEVNGEVDAIGRRVFDVEERMNVVEAAEAERNQIVGDLNKALDSIIARQKSFIGGEA